MIIHIILYEVICLIDKNGKKENKQEKLTRVEGRREPVTGVYIPDEDEVEKKREWSIVNKL